MPGRRRGPWGYPGPQDWWNQMMGWNPYGSEMPDWWDENYEDILNALLGGFQQYFYRGPEGERQGLGWDALAQMQDWAKGGMDWGMWDIFRDPRQPTGAAGTNWRYVWDPSTDIPLPQRYGRGRIAQQFPSREAAFQAMIPEYLVDWFVGTKPWEEIPASYREAMLRGPEAVEPVVNYEEMLQNLYAQIPFPSGIPRTFTPEQRLARLIQESPEDVSLQNLQKQIQQLKIARGAEAERGRTFGLQAWQQELAGLGRGTQQYWARQQAGLGGLTGLMQLGLNEQQLKNQIRAAMIRGIPEAMGLNLQEFATMLGGLQGFRSQDIQLLLSEMEMESRIAQAQAQAEADKGWCVVTSACTETKGLPDDCDELETLRKLRTWMKNNLHNGKELIAQYEKFAPLLVYNINKTSNPKSIWNQIYDQFIRPAVNLVKQGKNTQAVELYKNGMFELAQKYLGGQTNAIR